MAIVFRKSSKVYMKRKIKSKNDRYREIKLFGTVIISLQAICKVCLRNANGKESFEGWVSSKHLKLVRY